MGCLDPEDHRGPWEQEQRAAPGPAPAHSRHAEDLGCGAIDAIFAVALTEQERNQETW
jgi:hypothetical protein